MTEDTRIPTSMRALLILEILAKSDQPLTPTQINSELGLPKQTVHRLCSRLELDGFIFRDHTGKRFRHARRMREMASGILHGAYEQNLRHQILENLAHHVGETVNLVVATDKGMVYQDRVDTDWPLRIQLPIGSHVPFHCTASGKVFLASLTPQAGRKFVKNLELKGYTKNTFTSEEQLLENIRITRKSGFSVDQEEFMEGMVAIAVPIRRENGPFFGALALHGPRQRLSLEVLKSHLESLQVYAEKLAGAMLGE